MTMKNFLGGIKKAELKIIVAGESGNPEELIKSAISVTQFLEAKDFMVFCSVLNIYRSVGIRPYCAKFKNK